MRKLTEILEHYEIPADDVRDLSEVLLAWVDEVIGEDDTQKHGGPLYKEARNQLRAEQRKRVRS